MNLKCGYFAVGGIMCGSLVGIFVGALAVNASLGYMILLLGAWGCAFTSHRAALWTMPAARKRCCISPPKNLTTPTNCRPFTGRAMTGAMKKPLKVWPTPARRACGPRKARKKVLSLTTPLRADARALMQPPGWARVSSPGKCRERKECSCEKRRLGKGQE